jgi:hypothetical protein
LSLRLSPKDACGCHLMDRHGTNARHPDRDSHPAGVHWRSRRGGPLVEASIAGLFPRGKALASHQFRSRFDKERKEATATHSLIPGRMLPPSNGHACFDSRATCHPSTQCGSLGQRSFAWDRPCCDSSPSVSNFSSVMCMMTWSRRSFAAP